MKLLNLTAALFLGGVLQGDEAADAGASTKPFTGHSSAATGSYIIYQPAESALWLYPFRHATSG